MKKVFFVFVLSLFMAGVLCAAPKPTHFESSGEVTSVDPLYGRITIKHPAIKGFSGDGEAEFLVSSPGLLKGISKGDLVTFSITDEKGDARIEKILKTGVAPMKDESTPLGRVVQEVLVTTGEVAKTVSSPIAPAHEVVSGTVGAATQATDSVLHDATPEIKKKF